MTVTKLLVSAFLLAILGVWLASEPPGLGAQVSLTSVPPQENSASGPGVVRYGITREDAALIQETVPNIAAAVPVREFEAKASISERRSDATVIGTTADFARVVAIHLERGRFLVERDNARRESVVVIGSRLAKTLFPAENAIGRSIKLGSGYYSVVGQLVAPTTPDGRDLVDAAFIPIATMRGRFGDVVLKAEQGAFRAENYELSRLELVLERPDLDSRVETKNTVEALMKRIHERTDYRVRLLAAGDVLVQPTNAPVQNVPEFVLEAGTLESAKAVTLSCRLPGESTVLRVVPEGTVAKKGDVLVQLENSAIEDQVAKSRVELAVAERHVTALHHEIESAELEAEATTRTGKLQIEAAELEREQYFGAQGRHAVEAAALEREIAGAEAAGDVARQAIEIAEKARNSLALAEAKLKEIQANSSRANGQDALRLLNGPTKALRTKVLELQIEKAKFEKQRQLASSKRLLADLRSRHAGAEMELKFGKERLAKFKQQLASCTIVAPNDGVVIYATTASRRTSSPQLIRNGAVVRERQALVRVTNMEHLQVRVRVHESKIRKIRVGQKCELTFDALPGQQTPGVVTSVANVPVPGTFPNTDLKEYEVIVALDKPGRRLRLGMTCEARFLVGK